MNNAFPNKETAVYFIGLVRDYFYPNYFNKVNNVELIYQKMQSIFKEDISNKKEDFDFFFNHLDEVKSLLNKDIEMFYNSDPACNDTNEVIIAYPGFYTIFVHRIAHLLYQRGIYLFARLMSEYAHSKTGIDIHPGATIGEYFFIDHGTGVVIGETTIIGNYVKIYQGVTLGALSLSRGQKMKGEKRHPSIGNNVTIYSGASILGGNTHIGDNTTIGSCVFITKSIPANMTVINKEPELILKEIKK